MSIILIMLVDNIQSAPGKIGKRASTLDTHPLRSLIGDFLAALQELEKGPITTARLSAFLAEMRPSAKALAPYVLWNSQRYARNLIYRDALFEVLALCWLPGQQTPIHTHNGQLGWVTIVQGELVCRDYRFVRAPRDTQSREREFASRPYFSSRSRRVEVELVASTTCAADGRVTVVDRQQTTHQLANVEGSRHGTVSLHVYSKPIDRCVLFDEISRCWERRQLQYHSVEGTILNDAA